MSDKYISIFLYLYLDEDIPFTAHWIIWTDQ